MAFVRAAVFPTENGDGRILLVGNELRTVNCRQPTETHPNVARLPWGADGCGQALLSDGRLFLAGGAVDVTEPEPGFASDLAARQHRKCATCTPTGGSVTEAANLS